MSHHVFEHFAKSIRLFVICLFDSFKFPPLPVFSFIIITILKCNYNNCRNCDFREMTIYEPDWWYLSTLRNCYLIQIHVTMRIGLSTHVHRVEFLRNVHDVRDVTSDHWLRCNGRKQGRLRADAVAPSGKEISELWVRRSIPHTLVEKEWRRRRILQNKSEENTSWKIVRYFVLKSFCKYDNYTAQT